LVRSLSHLCVADILSDFESAPPLGPLSAGDARGRRVSVSIRFGKKSNQNGHGVSRNLQFRSVSHCMACVCFGVRRGARFSPFANQPRKTLRRPSASCRGKGCGSESGLFNPLGRCFALSFSREFTGSSQGSLFLTDLGARGINLTSLFLRGLVTLGTPYGQPLRALLLKGGPPLRFEYLEPAKNPWQFFCRPAIK